jgi:hypothetical protein
MGIGICMGIGFEVSIIYYCNSVTSTAILHSQTVSPPSRYVEAGTLTPAALNSSAMCFSRAHSYVGNELVLMSRTVSITEMLIQPPHHLHLSSTQIG